MWSFIKTLLKQLGYPQIIVLMTMESTFLPVPSELVVPPAAYRCSQGEMNLLLVILCSTLGSLIGATINYLLGYFLGRSIIYSLADTKVAKMLFINRGKLEKAEHYFNHYGKSSTFIGRLVPGIRHLISIPAGMAKMPFITFAGFTVLGSFSWSAILGVLGYFFGANQNLLNRYYRQISIVLLGIFVLFVIYLVWIGFRRKKK
ncbi:MAG TPA: DedA family protein [Candidatus Cloacimonadota bacterium]|nr:DedA family protein [Candidatus Cloacimonadota bacterium]HPT72347.1 DedA family protein [Candidatus Cloacimonadota bacterium]